MHIILRSHYLLLVLAMFSMLAGHEATIRHSNDLSGSLVPDFRRMLTIKPHLNVDTVKASAPTVQPKKPNLPNLQTELVYKGFYVTKSFSSADCVGEPDVSVYVLGKCFPTTVDDKLMYVYYQVLRSGIANDTIVVTVYEDEYCSDANGDIVYEMAMQPQCKNGKETFFSDIIPKLPMGASMSAYMSEDGCRRDDMIDTAATLVTPLHECYRFGKDEYFRMDSCSDVRGSHEQFFSDSQCKVTSTSHKERRNPKSTCSLHNGLYVKTYC